MDQGFVVDRRAASLMKRGEVGQGGRSSGHARLVQHDPLEEAGRRMRLLSMGAAKRRHGRRPDAGAALDAVVDRRVHDVGHLGGWRLHQRHRRGDPQGRLLDRNGWAASSATTIERPLDGSIEYWNRTAARSRRPRGMRRSLAARPRRCPASSCHAPCPRCR